RRPRTPAGCGMAMAELGVAAPGSRAASSPHTPRRSKMTRAPCDNASDRSPRAASPAARASSTTTSRSASATASASVAPTGPAPTTARSCSIGARRLSPAGGLDVGDRLRRRGRENVDAGRRDEHVVFDAHADIPEAVGHVVRRADIRTGLDRQHHAGHELLRRALHLVEAGVMHIEPEPMARAVHIELLEAAGLEHFVERSLAEAE